MTDYKHPMTLRECMDAEDGGSPTWTLLDKWLGTWADSIPSQAYHELCAIQNNTRPQSLPEAELPELVACLPTDSLKILDRLIDWLPDPTHPDNAELPIHKDAARLYAALQAAYGQQCAATRPAEVGGDGWLPIESAPTDELHIRGLWIRTIRDGHPDKMEWRAFVGYVDDSGRFVDPDYQEDFGWEPEDYDAWYALPSTPPAPGSEVRP